MDWKRANRQCHRWLSMIFTTLVVAIFASLGAGHEPAAWVYYLPLAPLALLMISGLCMFFAPLAAKWRGRPRRAA
jgi:ABC-type polysaccharide/polyol phosphate export permease